MTLKLGDGCVLPTARRCEGQGTNLPRKGWLGKDRVGLGLGLGYVSELVAKSASQLSNELNLLAQEGRSVISLP